MENNTPKARKCRQSKNGGWAPDNNKKKSWKLASKLNAQQQEQMVSWGQTGDSASKEHIAETLALLTPL